MAAKRSREASEEVTSTPDIDPYTESSSSQSAAQAAPYPAAEEEVHPPKIVHIDRNSAASQQEAIMRCTLPPHQPLSFISYEEHEVHCQEYHVNRCHDCLSNFPSNHYLDLHIGEHHDPLNEAKRAKGEKTVRFYLPLDSNDTGRYTYSR